MASQETATMTNEVGEHCCDLCGNRIGYKIGDVMHETVKLETLAGADIEVCNQCAATVDAFLTYVPER
jgi:hypothetical protein